GGIGSSLTVMIYLGIDDCFTTNRYLCWSTLNFHWTIGHRLAVTATDISCFTTGDFTCYGTVSTMRIVCLNRAITACTVGIICQTAGHILHKTTLHINRRITSYVMST